jgi:hypothetical protein
MPLSEHEERILSEIERQLAAEDPRFVARARRPLRGLSRTARLRVAVLLGVIGFVNLLLLVVHIAFGAVGMSLLLVAILLGARAVQEPPALVDQVPPDERT